MNNLNSSPLPKEIVSSMSAIRSIGLKLVFKNWSRNSESESFFPELIMNRIWYRRAEKNDTPYDVHYSNHFEILTPKWGLEESWLYHLTIEKLSDKGVENIGGFEFIFHRDKEMFPKIHDKIAFTEFLLRFKESMKTITMDQKETDFRLKFDLGKSASPVRQVAARVWRAVSWMIQNSRAKKVEKQVKKKQPE